MKYGKKRCVKKSIQLNVCLMGVFSIISMIKLLGERIGTVRSEEVLNDRLITVEELRRLRQKFDRKNLSKEDILVAIKRMLRTN